MSSASIPRTSIDPCLHGAIDTELKNLKLLGRRLQSALVIHATELQLLQRLYYKNKNQHRGAVFWRNVIEVRRFLERIERLGLQDLLNTLRCKFYDTTQNVNSVKGPWTHSPDPKYLSNYSIQCQKALQLFKKTAERCIDAYSSFHRSLQSAAFLQILLMFVAISSRTRTLAIELDEILELIHSCVSRLSSIMANSGGTDVNEAVPDIPIASPQGMDRKTIESTPSPATNDGKLVPYLSANAPPNQIRTKNSSTYVVIERVASGTLSTKKPEQVKERSGLAAPKKRKRTAIRNEIDDIFGF